MNLPSFVVAELLKFKDNLRRAKEKEREKKKKSNQFHAIFSSISSLDFDTIGFKTYGIRINKDSTSFLEINNTCI